MHAADQLDDDIASVVEHVDCRRSDEPAIDAGPFFRFVANENSSDVQLDIVTRTNSRALAIDEFDESAPDSSASEQSDGDPATHANTRCATTVARNACCRSSMRSRTSSSPTDSRIRLSPMPTLRRTSGSTDACVIVAG